MTLLKQILPDIYFNLLDSQLLNSEVTETKANCANCTRSRDKRFLYLYKPDLKCCTFYPFVPNFAIGGILHHQLKGAEVFKNHLQQKKFTLPLGAFPTLQFQYEFMNREFTDFGNREDLLCPYYDRQENNCKIWNYRGVVCTTYFCTSNRGAQGQNFWKNLSDYLSYIEMSLAEECLVQLDFSPRDISDQLNYLNRTEWTAEETIQQSIDAKEFKLFWNGYTDYEEFYLKCFNHIKNMSKKEFNEIMSSQGKELLKRLK